MATYSSSALCAEAAGMPSQSASSFPTTTQIDGYRNTYYNKIGRIIGHGVADVNDVAKFIEIDVVARKIKNVMAGAIIYEEDFLPSEVNDLCNTFGVAYGWGFEEPGKNT